MPRHLAAICALVDAMNKRDPAALQACYAPDVVIQYPGRPLPTPAEIAALDAAVLQNVPDYHVTPTALFAADGESVVLQPEMSGTQRAELRGPLVSPARIASG